MVAKVAGGIIGLGLISTGSIAFAKPEWLGLNKEIPWTPLSSDHDFSSQSSTYSSDKFGTKYKYYLVGVIGTKSGAGQENTNKAMWDDLFKKWKKDYDEATGDKSSLGKEFKEKIESGIKVGNDATGNNKYLNTVCEAIYKTTTSEITSEGTNDKYKESSVWKYCSGLGEKPKTVEEVDANKYKEQVSGKDPIGKNNDNRKKLVSTKGNDKFWEIRNKEFRGDPGYDKIEGNDAEADLFFHPANKTESIRQLCEKAYQQPEASENKSTADNPKKDKALKYCSLDKQ